MCGSQCGRSVREMALSALDADYLYDVVTALGTESNAAAATAVDWWAGLLALFQIHRAHVAGAT